MKRLTNLLAIVLVVLFFDLPIASADGPPVKWERTFGGSANDRSESVQQTLDGGYIIAGATQSFGAGGLDVYLIKTDPNGTNQWEKTFGGSSADAGFSVQQTLDGGYIIAGSTQSFGAGSWDVYLIKTDPNGNSEWEKTFGASGAERSRSVQQTLDGGYIIAGYTKSFGAGDWDVYLIKTDPNGNIQWEKTLGGSSHDRGKAVQQTLEGGYIIVGATQSFSVGALDVYLIKYLIKLCSDGTLAGDLDCDGTVNFEDVAILAFQWLQERSISYPPADIAGVGDGNVNFLDYCALAEDFGEGSPP
jgi:hypothetical protein